MQILRVNENKNTDNYSSVLNKDSIIQNIINRHSSLGIDVSRVKIIRTPVNAIRVYGAAETGPYFNMFSFFLNDTPLSGCVSFKYVDSHLLVLVTCPDYFKETELFEMGVWLIENFQQ